MWNTNERAGKIDQAQGKVKQAVGTLTGDDRLTAEGKADDVIGQVESAVGSITHKAGDALTEAGKAVKK